MVRTFETRNPLRMSPERFMALRVDESFDHAMAELEQQILHIPTREETEDGLMHKVSEFEWKESPVPPLFRGLLGSEDAKMTVEETFDPRRVSFASAKQMKTVLPGKLSELLRIDVRRQSVQLMASPCLRECGSSMKWWGGARLRDGSMLAIPNNASHVVHLRPDRHRSRGRCAPQARSPPKLRLVRSAA